MTIGGIREDYGKYSMGFVGRCGVQEKSGGRARTTSYCTKSKDTSR